MNTATESVLFNALPLLVVAGAYLAVAAALLPVVWRERNGAHPLEIATATIFPAGAVVFGLLGGIALHDRRPVGDHLWITFAAACIALVPAILMLLRWGDRALLTGGLRRAQVAETLLSLRDREVEALARIATALARASNLESASRPLVDQVRELLGVPFAGVALIDADGANATGVVALLDGEDVAWWRELRLDLRNEPSVIASVAFDGAPVTIYDIGGSPIANPQIVERVGAQSVVCVPIVAEDRVVGVVLAATTDRKHAFTLEEVALLQALAGETALAFDRIRAGDALAASLAREQRIATIARKLRGELDSGELVRTVTKELRSALRLDSVGVELGGVEADGVPVGVGAERFGTLAAERAFPPLDDSDRLLLEAAARELGVALHAARLVDENQRRLEQQGALLAAAQVVTSELDLDTVLERLVEEVTKLLGADAADCYLLDTERGVLRCAAVNGLDSALIGREFPAASGVAGLALSRERPVTSEDYEQLEARFPHAAYEGFSHALVAPMVWAGEARGVLGVGTRAGGRPFDRADTDLLEAFAGLASLALRNAESFGESTRQTRVQRAFFVIASLLSEQLSLAETLHAAAKAATEALGGDFGAVFMVDGGRLSVAGACELPDAVRALVPPPALRDAALDGRTVAASSVAEDERFDASWREAPFASLLAIPVEGALRGLVVVFFDTAHTFSGDDLELAQQVAQGARSALERSRLYETERTARALSQQLARMGSMLGSELDPAVILEELVEQATALLDADAGAVLLLEGDELVITAASGEGVEPALGARSPSTGWLGGDVVQLRAPVAQEDVSTDSARADADALVALGYRAYLGVPLTGRDGALLGVLAVYGADPRAWREDEVEVFAALAASACVALANAELYQQLAIEHDQSVAILANVADGIVAVDREGRVVVWNGAAEEITGVPAGEALGREPADVLRRELRSESGGTSRLVPILRGSEEVWLSLSEAVMRDPAGAVAGRIFAFRDISGERFVEQMKSDFVATVSHELRTPLTSIYGFAETLLRRDIDFDDVERQTFLGYIASESERLTQIVDALLNVARLDSGDLQVELRPTDVGEVFSAAVTERVRESQNGHRFVVDLEDGVPAVHADAEKLRQVLDELLENAVKYSPAGGVVRVEARRLHDSVEISVADEGVGIPFSRLDRIFGKFYRGGNEQPGTGLGLFIAQGLVAAMGGKIQVHSKEGSGSRFTFELPMAQKAEVR